MPDLTASTPHNEEVPKPKRLLGVRHLQFVLMFFTLGISYGMRSSLSVAIIAMTSKTPGPDIPSYPEWDNVDLILSSFFFGYIFPQLGAGQLSEYFGPKWFLVGTMAVGSVFHVAIPPMAASIGSTGMIICRVIQGFTQGFLYPSLHNLISKWSPQFERSRTSNFVYGASSIGTAVSLPVTGAIAASNGGWPLAFYVWGGIGIVWAVIFAILAENSPSTHSWMSETERKYIEHNCAVTISTKKIPTPWKSIFRSLPLWSIFFVGCAQGWGSFTLLTEIPSYLSNIMNFDIKDNSQLSALPYVAYFFIGLTTSPLTDYLISHKLLSVTNTRKLFQSLGNFGPAAALIGLSFVDSSQKELATVLLILSVGTNGFFQSGYLVNLIDIAPNHAGTLFGLVNGVNNIFSILGPLTVGLLGDDKTDPILWRKVFLLAAGIFIGCCLFYDIFTSAEVQPWNEPEERDEESARKPAKTVLESES